MPSRLQGGPGDLGEESQYPSVLPTCPGRRSEGGGCVFAPRGLLATHCNPGKPRGTEGGSSRDRERRVGFTGGETVGWENRRTPPSRPLPNLVRCAQPENRAPAEPAERRQ